MAYLTMLQTRASMVNASATVLSEACTVAIRYSAIRRQGFINNSTADYKAEQYQVIDYPIQRHRLLKCLSQVIAIKAAANQMDDMMVQASEEDLGELHATSSSLKAYCTTVAATGIEQMRKCCGGAGFLAASGVGELESFWKGAFEQAEGDPAVLTLQHSRKLIKTYQAAKKGENVPKAMAYVKLLKDPQFDPIIHARPDSNFISENNLDGLLQFMRYRALVVLHEAASRFETALSEIKNFDLAWTKSMRWLHAASVCHTIYFILLSSINWTKNIPDIACRATLEKLVAYYALSEMEDGYQWGGLLTYQDQQNITIALQMISDNLRNEMVGVVTAFDISDATLNSVIGRRDGNVYEAIYESAIKSPLNIRADGSRITVPASLGFMEKYLDKEFLAKGELEISKL